MRFLYFLILILLVSCSSQEQKRLNYSLLSAGENREELEKVLAWFKDDPLKFQAASFLICNMPGHIGYDADYIQKFQSIYDEYADISSSYNWERSGDWYNSIDSLWKVKKEQVNSYSREYKKDIEIIKADWLIRQIELAFKAWQENVYTRDGSFETFCRYILPYRIIHGIPLDDCRPVFYERHAGIYSNPEIDFREASDSLHYQYSFLKHNNFAALSLPIVDARTMEQIKRATCDHMAWYNVLLMTSLGMAATIDYVPAWGNRNGAHRWNALVIQDETYPFEPFWDDDRWKYKTIYNNQTFDLLHGKFRLPKVFRHTYEYNAEGPVSDKNVNREDVPAIFLNPFVEDVSSEYFETTDVTLQLAENIPDVSYCYLCVFESKRWHPVHWGKIQNKNKVTFKDMGRDIVYFPMYFINGKYKPAAVPFLLDSQGEIHELKPGKGTHSLTLRTPTSYFFPNEIEESKQLIRGAKLIACNEEQPDDPTILYTFSDTIELFYNRANVPPVMESRYYRLINLPDTFGLCEISFYEETKNGPKKIPDVTVSGNLINLGIDTEGPGTLVDGLSTTGFKGTFIQEKELLFDLGRPLRVSQIEFVPYTGSFVEDTHVYNLYYWGEDKWELLQTLPGDDQPITFENVPEGAIYRLQKSPDYFTERIFTYQDGIIHWY